MAASVKEHANRAQAITANAGKLEQAAAHYPWTCTVLLSYSLSSTICPRFHNALTCDLAATACDRV
jgi:hypothetical protein